MRTTHDEIMPAKPPRPPARRVACAYRYRRWAFSFVEMLVVVIILGIVAAVAAPTFHRSWQHHRLESAARRVKQDLEYLQTTARAKSTSLTCEFDGNKYTLGGAALRGLDRNQGYEVDLSAPPYELESVTVDLDGEPAIEFDGFGETVHDATITLGLGGATRTIELDAGTGQITTSAGT